MFKRLSIVLSGLFLLLPFQSAHATIALYDWAYNIDGAISENFAGDSMPTTGALDGSGLGTLTYEITGAGNHNFIAFFDFEIDEAINTFFNEYGTSTGTLAAGQSWEIDEPGWVFGDIYDNMLNGSLDGTNAVPSALPDDVSFALGWNFDLAAGETATITLNLADVLPTVLPTFMLTQSDTDSQESIYFWSDLSIAGTPTGVPEPGTLALLAIGLLGFSLTKRKI
jgi:hypothetical protein